MIRRFAALAALAGALAAYAPVHAESPAPLLAPATISPADRAVLDDLSERTFRFFWDSANPANGLIPDRYPRPSFSSIAAVGFGLTAYTIGVDRGYITRRQAVDRVLATLRFLRDAPQGPQAQGNAGYKGFFYHFLDMKTGARSANSELSTVDTALLLGGVLHAQSYFGGAGKDEAEIRSLADEIYRRVDWNWATQARPPAVALAWSPEHGMSAWDWRGYNEAMLVYVLGLGSPTHALPAQAWAEWTSTYGRSWQRQYGRELLFFAPMFGHQYSHIWIDVRGIQDDYMRKRGMDYFENSRRAAYVQRDYAIANPLGCKGYGATLWGVTASDGPAALAAGEGGARRAYHSYAGRGMGADHYDDCTIAPTGAAASIAFAPEIAIPAITDMRERYGRQVYGKYGFLDAFNLDFDLDANLREGRREPGFGWVDTALLLGGVLHVQSYFGGAGKDEAEIRSLADEIYRRVDWNWATQAR
ncbi:MAG TPA: glucoamylase family protein, partial [Ramlibacter sp.]